MEDGGGDDPHQQTNVRHTVLAGERLGIAIIHTLEGTKSVIRPNFAIHPHIPEIPCIGHSLYITGPHATRYRNPQ